jgi:hypothetical protein
VLSSLYAQCSSLCLFVHTNLSICKSPWGKVSYFHLSPIFPTVASPGNLGTEQEGMISMHDLDAFTT